MSNERYPNAVEFEVIDRATCYVVTNGEVQTEQAEVPGRLNCIRLYAEGEWVTEYVRGESIDNPDDLAVVLKAAETAGIELANRGGSFGVPGDD